MKNFLKYTLATITGIIIASILFFITMIASISALVASGDKPASISDNSILVLKAGVIIPDRGNQNPLAGIDLFNMTFTPAPGLNEILQNIEKASTDSKIKGILIENGLLPSGWATMGEIRNALEKFRMDGKFVISYSDYVLTQECYYLSTAADKIYINPGSMVDFKGLSSDIMFYKKALEIVPLINGYLQISVNAGKAETYSKIHQAPIAHWDIVWRNIEGMVRVKEALEAKECDIGVNMTLLIKETLKKDGSVIPSNWREAEFLVRRARDAGINYVALKPYSQDAYGKNTARLYGDIRYNPQMEEIRALGRYLTDTYSSTSFEVVFRISRFEEYELEDRGYNACLATPMVWSYIQSDGSWLSCSAHWTNPLFILGNINSQTVDEIWFNNLRREHMRFVLNKLDVCGYCRKGCHLDKENRYMTKLTLMSDEEFKQEMARLRTLPRPKNANFI